ncbi:MAG TPA: S4 domain-containing protein, partial [Bacteroidia bacterium]|nr:S4 domain-containing protein [Bacteroidia bacterium]
MKKKYNSDKGHRKEKKTFHKRDDRKKDRDERKSYGDRKEERGRGDDRKSDRPFRKGDDRKRERYHDERKEHGHKEERGGSFDRKPDRPFRRGNDRRRPFNKKWKPENIKKAFTKSDSLTSSPSVGSTSTASEQIRLNKYLSNAGICSRREADKFITAGVVTVNGKIITELGYKVNPNDKIQFGGNKVNKEKTVYVLLNKPKGYITTCDDPQERDTVMDLIKEVQERVYPV